MVAAKYFCPSNHKPASACPLPAIVIEESEPPVESEICRATVNYTDVAPFGEPVTGGEN